VGRNRGRVGPARKTSRRSELRHPKVPRKKRKPRDEVRRNMAAIRAQENRSEVLLRKSLFALGLRYRKYCRDLPGRPDIVFRRERLAVFVDGDYWHGRLLREQGLAAVRRYFHRDQYSYWIGKLQGNVLRDDRATETLERLGWKVIRVWESDVKHDLERVRDSVALEVLARRMRPNAGPARGPTLGSTRPNVSCLTADC
jgi:DNA mismatch endonuclease (patch repair protein)